GGRQPRHTQGMHGHARDGRGALRAREMNVVAPRDERRQQAGGRALDTAVEGGRAGGQEGLDVSLSMGGKSGARAGAEQVPSRQRGRARAPSVSARTGSASSPAIALASAGGSPGGTTTPQPSSISGIIETEVATTGRAIAMASTSLAGTCPTVSVVARWGTATTSAAARKRGTSSKAISPMILTRGQPPSRPPRPPRPPQPPRGAPR